jgi:putative membrane protein
LSIVTSIIIGVIALLHLYFLVLEMFLWDKPAGLKAFGQTKEQAESSKVLAANQGLYNGFLAAGLIWGLAAADHGFYIKIFFLTCILIAGVFGGLTANRKILVIQAFPALIALVLLHL